MVKRFGDMGRVPFMLWGLFADFCSLSRCARLEIDPDWEREDIGWGVTRDVAEGEVDHGVHDGRYDRDPRDDHDEWRRGRHRHGRRADRDHRSDVRDYYRGGRQASLQHDSRNPRADHRDRRPASLWGRGSGKLSRRAHDRIDPRGGNDDDWSDVRRVRGANRQHDEDRRSVRGDGHRQGGRGRKRGEERDLRPALLRERGLGTPQNYHGGGGGEVEYRDEVRDRNKQHPHALPNLTGGRRRDQEMLNEQERHVGEGQANRPSLRQVDASTSADEATLSMMCPQTVPSGRCVQEGLRCEYIDDDCKLNQATAKVVGTCVLTQWIVTEGVAACPTAEELDAVSSLRQKGSALSDFDSHVNSSVAKSEEEEEEEVQEERVDAEADGAAEEDNEEVEAAEDTEELMDEIDTEDRNHKTRTWDRPSRRWQRSSGVAFSLHEQNATSEFRRRRASMEQPHSYSGGYHHSHSPHQWDNRSPNYGRSSAPSPPASNSSPALSDRDLVSAVSDREAEDAAARGINPFDDRPGPTDSEEKALADKLEEDEIRKDDDPDPSLAGAAAGSNITGPVPAPAPAPAPSRMPTLRERELMNPHYYRDRYDHYDRRRYGHHEEHSHGHHRRSLLNRDGNAVDEGEEDISDFVSDTRHEVPELANSVSAAGIPEVQTVAFSNQTGSLPSTTNSDAEVSNRSNGGNLSLTALLAIYDREIGRHELEDRPTSDDIA